MNTHPNPSLKTYPLKTYPIKTYTVGGAVRDQLLGLTPHEIDTLVIGSTPEEMLSLGFIPVGKHFPVFLHPTTHAEFALARTERKVGPGHQGFEFFADPSVTVEQDLSRRDLTINAIAQDEFGNLIDPYGGQLDLNNKILRHVSPAFTEDPLRVFRVARFMAQLADFNFKIAPETLELMKKISQSGELNSLSDERIWEETLKALKFKRADLYFDTLIQTGSIDRCFENFDAQTLRDFVSPLVGETGLKVEPKAREGASPEINPEIKLALFLFNPEIKIKIKIPGEYLDLILLTRKFYKNLCEFKSPAELVDLLENLDFFRRSERFYKICSICEKLSLIQNHFLDLNLIRNSCELLKNLDPQKIIQDLKNPSGPEIQKAIHQERVNLVCGFFGE